MKHFNYEFTRMKHSTLPMFLLTFISQICFLYFFAIVGKFDQDQANNILTKSPAVISLASTATMCVIAIYGAVVISHLIVKDYVGMNRNRTYLLPTSRKELFYTKMLVFSYIVVIAQISGLLLSNLIFMLSEKIIPILKGSILNYWGDFLIASIICVGLTLTIILFSSVIGIQWTSPIKTIVSSIIFVVLLSNLSAMSIITFKLLTLLIVVLILVIAFFLILKLGDHIEKSDA